MTAPAMPASLIAPAAFPPWLGYSVELEGVCLPVSCIRIYESHWDAVPPVAELELAFEVGAPQVIGHGALGQRRAARAVSPVRPRQLTAWS
jgi:hypothetical protein